MNGMALQFSRVVSSPVEDMEIWKAKQQRAFSFVISYESSAGPGFHGTQYLQGRGQNGFVASWRPIHQKQVRREDYRLAL